METGSRMLMGSTGYHARGAYYAQSPPELYTSLTHSFIHRAIHSLSNPPKQVFTEHLLGVRNYHGF